MNDFQHKVISILADRTLVWIVGGAVRDAVLGIDCGDIDLATLLPMEDAETLLRQEGFTPRTIGMRFKTLSVFQEKSRVDIIQIESPEKDALRRDFTINALYQEPAGGRIIDPLSGLRDLNERRLKSCGDAGERFDEDPVRILRMIKFAVRFGLDIEQNTWEKAKELLPRLNLVPKERTTAELAAILTLDEAEKAVRMLENLGYWQGYAPELARLKGIVQNQYHSLDVWEHTLAVFRATPPDLFLRLAGLFHDIGKWETASRECFVRGRLTYRLGSYFIEGYRLIGLRGGRELDHKIKSLIGKDITILGTRLDHHPDIVQFKKIAAEEAAERGLIYKLKGKRHFLNHEKASATMLERILKRYTFSMFFSSSGQSRERDLIKLVGNHMQATLAFMPEFRGEIAKRSFKDRAAELTWKICWDGRDYKLQHIHDFVILWKADFNAKKVHDEAQNKTLERVLGELISTALWQNENLSRMGWEPLYSYASARGLEGERLGRFKELVTVKAMLEMDISLNEVFLNKAFACLESRR